MWEYFISGIFVIIGTGLGSFITWKIESTKHLHELDKYRIKLEVDAYSVYLSAVSEITDELTNFKFDESWELAHHMGNPRPLLKKLKDARHDPFIISDKNIHKSYKEFASITDIVHCPEAPPHPFSFEDANQVKERAEKAREDVTEYVSKKFKVLLQKMKI